VLYDEWDETPADVHVGIYKTTDGGSNWNAVNDGLPADSFGIVSVSALTIDPKNSTTLYAGTFRGVFKSTNGGASWSASSSNMTETVNSLVIDPLNPNTVYAGTSEHGVFKTTDAGSTWSVVSPGLTTLYVHDLVIDPQDPHRLFAGTPGGVFAMTFGPDLGVTELQFDRTTVLAGGSFSASVSGPNLPAQTFFDVRFSSPANQDSAVVLNWQRGLAANHDVPTGTALGGWTITGVRAHEIETDHSGGFSPVSATITVFQ
jgi:photosystem II stability/assembly factor-like uncharacterized protein